MDRIYEVDYITISSQYLIRRNTSCSIRIYTNFIKKKKTLLKTSKLKTIFNNYDSVCQEPY